MNKRLLAFCTFISLCYACNQNNLPSEEKAIRELLKQEQRAHLEEDIDLFVSEFAPGMVAVNRGEVSVSTTEEHKERFKNYFENVEFIKWEDKVPAIIKLSDDGKMGYAIIQKQVIVTVKETNFTTPDTTDFAWVSILRKTDGQWKIECNVSTNKPK